ncbi:amastin-like surface protein, putative [Leishmania guyanensis]
MAWSVGLLIYAVVQFVAFLLVLVATPIDIFWFGDDGFTASPNRCYTLWGYKQKCSNTYYSLTLDELYPLCPARRNRFRAAQAFAVISIFVYGAAFVLGVIMLLCHRRFRWVCLALNSVGVVTLCIVWASMAMTYNRDEGRGCPAEKDYFSYGTGFYFFLLAWLLDIANIPVLLFLCQDSGSGESGNATGNKGQE